MLFKGNYNTPRSTVHILQGQRVFSALLRKMFAVPHWNMNHVREVNLKETRILCYVPYVEKLSSIWARCDAVTGFKVPKQLAIFPALPTRTKYCQNLLSFFLDDTPDRCIYLDTSSRLRLNLLMLSNSSVCDIQRLSRHCVTLTTLETSVAETI